MVFGRLSIYEGCALQADGKSPIQDHCFLEERVNTVPAMWTIKSEHESYLQSLELFCPLDQRSQYLDRISCHQTLRYI